MTQQKKTSFSLIELLVVMALFRILTSLVMPSLRSIKQSSETLSCLNNMRQITTNSRIYTEDWNGANHMGAEPGWYNLETHSRGGWQFWYKFLENQYLEPYDQMFNCPSSTVSYGPNLGLEAKYRNINSYGYNYRYGQSLRMGLVLCQK